MRIIVRLLMGLALVGSPACLSNVCAAPVKPGRWVLIASGRPVLVLELSKNARAKGGWTGALTAPKHFDVDATFTNFSNVQGPAKVEPVVSANGESDRLELTVRDSDSSVDHLVWTPSAEGGTLAFQTVGAKASLVPASAATHVGGTWDKARVYSASVAWPDNAEMTAIFNADQGDRKGPELGKIDWSVVGPRDEARRARTKELLDSGKLHTGDDFYHAAFVFQHGSTPNDYLLAHTLAVIAAARGRKDAAWIAAATLDRYLMNIGQKQIYGTQFVSHDGGAMSQEPYDRALISDALRAELGVPPKNDQEQRLKDLQAQLEVAKGHP